MKSVFRGLNLLQAAMLTTVVLLIGCASSDADQAFFDNFEPRLAGVVESEVAVRTEDGSTEKLELIYKPDLELRLGDNLKLYARGRARVDARDRLEPGQPDQDSVDPLSRRLLIGNKAELELREFYFDSMIGDAFVRLGKQQIVWGQADGLKVLDIVNPQSFREFILDEFEDSRIPLWALNVEVPFSKFDLQFIWIPDQTYDILPESGAAYAFTSPKFVPPAPPPHIPLTVNSIERPGRFFKDSDVGLRLSAFVNGWDLSLNYLYHYFDQPVFFQTLSSNGVIVAPRYERSHLLGGTFSNAFGDFVLRGEVAFNSDRFFLTDDARDKDGVVRSDEYGYVVGLDWSGMTDTLISGQLFQSMLSKSPAGLVRDRVESVATLLVRRHFWNETLQLDMIWLSGLNEGDGLIRPKVRYQYTNDIALSFGADIFYGSKDGLFGEFKERDRLVFGVEWWF